MTTVVEDLRTVLRDLLQGAADHQELMAEQTGEMIHIVLRDEYRSAITLLPKLVDEVGRFRSDKERLLVRQVLDQYHDDIEASLPLRALHVRSVIAAIDQGNDGPQVTGRS